MPDPHTEKHDVPRITAGPDDSYPGQTMAALSNEREPGAGGLTNGAPDTDNPDADNKTDTEPRPVEDTTGYAWLNWLHRIFWWAGFLIQLPSFLDLFGIPGTNLFFYFPIRMSTTDPKSAGFFDEWYPRILVADITGILCWVIASLLKHMMTRRLNNASAVSQTHGRRPLIITIILTAIVLTSLFHISLTTFFYCPACLLFCLDLLL